MIHVAVIGLGPMGVALARLLVAAGHRVTVWNATPRLDAVPGARVASAPQDAIAAAELVLICLRNIAVVRSVLVGSCTVLPGRRVVNLSSGSPGEAQSLADWISARDAEFIDGAVMNNPEEMGKAGSRILLAGPAPLVAAITPHLACLAGELRHVGPSYRAAKALYQAFEMVYFGHLAAALHAADICLSEGISLPHLHALHDADPTHQGFIDTLIQGNYRPANQSMSAWASDLALIRQQAAEAGISAPFPDMLSVLFDRAIAAGHGQDDVMAIWKTMT